MRQVELCSSRGSDSVANYWGKWVNFRRKSTRFDRKVADFLICSKQLTPIVVIELDDSSHHKKLTQDADRDAMLRNAGYQTIRYPRIPAQQQIQLDIETALKKLTAN